MTDKPTTLAIDQSEWRVLFAASVQRMQEFIGQNHTLSQEHLTAMLAHLDRAKVLAVAWHKAALPAAPETVSAPVQETNGVAPRRRGRPPGSGKKRNAPMQVVQ